MSGTWAAAKCANCGAENALFDTGQEIDGPVSDTNPNWFSLRRALEFECWQCGETLDGAEAIVSDGSHKARFRARVNSRSVHPAHAARLDQELAEARDRKDSVWPGLVSRGLEPFGDEVGVAEGMEIIPTLVTIVDLNGVKWVRIVARMGRDDAANVWVPMDAVVHASPEQSP